MWKNVHPGYGAGIRTHDLWNVNLLPLPLDQGSRVKTFSWQQFPQLQITLFPNVTRIPNHKPALHWGNNTKLTHPLSNFRVQHSYAEIKIAELLFQVPRLFLTDHAELVLYLSAAKLNTLKLVYDIGFWSGYIFYSKIFPMTFVHFHSHFCF